MIHFLHKVFAQIKSLLKPQLLSSSTFDSWWCVSGDLLAVDWINNYLTSFVLH